MINLNHPSLTGKYYTLMLLLLYTLPGWAQQSAALTAQIENGLHLQQTVPVGESLKTQSIEALMKQYKVYGLSVAVVDKGTITWQKGYGFIEADSEEAVRPDTRFQCASIGKIMTAIAVLQLVEQEKISLDEPVNPHLKGWQVTDNALSEEQPVTLRHLLSHSAGLADSYGFEGYKPGSPIPSLIASIESNKPANTKQKLEVKWLPGTKEQYSGGGYLILQLLIESLSGQTFAAYVEEHVFGPLEMKHSRYTLDPIAEGLPLASGHLGNGKRLKNRFRVFPEYAAAGPWTTPGDLARLLIAMQESYLGHATRLLSQPLMQQCLTRQINNKGLGVNLKGLGAPQAFWHAGNNLGYTGLLYGLLNRQQGAVILLNSDGGEQLMQQFITSVAHAYDWPVMQSISAVALPGSQAEALAGLYEEPETGHELLITQTAAGLQLSKPGSRERVDLLHLGELKFTSDRAQDYLRLSFATQPSARGRQLYFEQNPGVQLTLYQSYKPDE